MGINKTIYEGIKDSTYTYGLWPEDIEIFLTVSQDFTTRQANAIKIIEGIMTAHGKKELLQHVVQLAKVEHGIRELEPWVRDHVVHALLSFSLGIFVNDYLLKPSNHRVDPFQWKMAGLFHDVGYPAEVAKNILKPYTDQINSIKRDLSSTRPDVFFRIVPVGMNDLSNGVNSLDMIQICLDRWNLRIDAKKEYERMVSSGAICHGIISSLSILYVVDLMYQKYNSNRKHIDIFEPEGINWNQSYFENDVVPACAAIFVHNLPARCFKSAPLDRKEAALPFLLRLSDCLQDWDRPSAANPSGFPDDDFDIKITPGKLTFTVTDPERRKKIAHEITTSLVAPDIDIIGP